MQSGLVQPIAQKVLYERYPGQINRVQWNLITATSISPWYINPQTNFERIENITYTKFDSKSNASNLIVSKKENMTLSKESERNK